MKRILPFIIILFFSNDAYAQTYHQVTHTSLTQTIGGSQVTVSSWGHAFVYSSIGSCNQGPYGIGGVNTTEGAYKFSFSVPPTAIRLHFDEMGYSEAYYVRVNGVMQSVTLSNISPFSGTCSGTFPLPSVISDTVKNNNPFHNNTIHQLDLLPGFPIDSITVIGKVPSAGNGIRTFSFYFSFDTMMTITQPYTATTYCQGDSIYVPYTVSSSFAPGNVFTLQLSNALGSFASPVTIGTKTGASAGTIGGELPAATPPGTGYRVRIVSNAPARTSKDNITNISVKAIPAVTAGSNSAICAGSSLNLTATAPGGSSYSWSGPGAYGSGLQNPSISNAQTGHSGDYIVTATLSGCLAKDTVTVLVKPMPALPTANNNGPLCPGDSLGLTSNNTTAGLTYSWAGPGSYSSNQQNPSILNVNSGHGGAYTVITTLNGCSTNTQTTVVVKPVPAVPTAGSNSPVCAGGVLNLAANSTTGGVTYSWTGPNSFTSNTQNPAINPVTINDAGGYSVTATLNGCTSAAGSASVTVNNVSSIGAYPSPNDTLCQMGPNANFVAVPNNGGSSPQYQWFKNNNLIGGATSMSYPATGIANGDTFYCRMTALGICSDPLVLFSNKVGMTVLPPAPPPAISIAASPGTLLSPWQTVSFTATPGGNAGSNPKYQWKRNGSDIIGATSNNWSANNLSDNDEISCVITSSEWCANPANVESSKIAIHIKTGIDDIAGSHRYLVYPNPVADELSIEGEAGMKVSIVNVIGQEVYRGVLNSSKEVIDISQLAPGNYVLQLVGSDGVRSVVKMEKE